MASPADPQPDVCTSGVPSRRTQVQQAVRGPRRLPHGRTVPARAVCPTSRATRHQGAGSGPGRQRLPAAWCGADRRTAPPGTIHLRTSRGASAGSGIEGDGCSAQVGGQPRVGRVVVGSSARTRSGRLAPDGSALSRPAERLGAWCRPAPPRSGGFRRRTPRRPVRHHRRPDGARLRSHAATRPGGGRCRLRFSDGAATPRAAPRGGPAASLGCRPAEGGRGGSPQRSARRVGARVAHPGALVHLRPRADARSVPLPGSVWTLGRRCRLRVGPAPATAGDRWVRLPPGQKRLPQ